MLHPPSPSSLAANRQVAPVPPACLDGRAGACGAARGIESGGRGARRRICTLAPPSRAAGVSEQVVRRQAIIDGGLAVRRRLVREAPHGAPPATYAPPWPRKRCTAWLRFRLIDGVVLDRWPAQPAPTLGFIEFESKLAKFGRSVYLLIKSRLVLA